jgi:glycosyltransferase involved in cell wall biosynthesis
MTDVSVVVPVFDEEGSLVELHRRLTEVMTRLGRSYEIIFVDDGSRDRSLGILREIFDRDPATTVLSFRRRYGKSAALAMGFEEARGRTIVTIDADLQDDPGEIPALLARLDQGYDLVSGWKMHRRDPLSKTIPSKIFNTVTAWVTGLKLHDMNCGLKAYRREVTDEIKLYGQLHRFLPVFAHKESFRVGEVPVTHHPREFGKTKYGARRFVHGFLDLMTVVMVTGYTKSPLHFFGTVGIVLSAVGLGINLFLLHLKMVYHNIQGRTPLLMLGVLLMILGFQLISTGLLAELITRAGHKGSKEYSFKARFSHGETQEARHPQAT